MSIDYGQFFGQDASPVINDMTLEYKYPKFPSLEIDLKTKVQRLEIEIEELKKVIENLMLIIETKGIV